MEEQEYPIVAMRSAGAAEASGGRYWIVAERLVESGPWRVAHNGTIPAVCQLSAQDSDPGGEFAAEEHFATFLKR